MINSSAPPTERRVHERGYPYARGGGATERRAPSQLDLSRNIAHHLMLSN